VSDALAAFEAERARISDPQERWAVRVRRYEEAQRALQRASIDDGSLMPSLLSLRDQMIGTPDADSDYAAMQAELIRTGVQPTATEADLANAAVLASAGRDDELAAEREAAARSRAVSDIERSRRHVDDPATRIDDFTAVLRQGTFAALDEEHVPGRGVSHAE
jgi:predicted metal-dependent hydrolase